MKNFILRIFHWKKAHVLNDTANKSNFLIYVLISYNISEFLQGMRMMFIFYLKNFVKRSCMQAICMHIFLYAKTLQLF